MMPRIRALPPDVVTQIAAGEVIERPASVVKELVENSLDAGATRIDVELEAGGTELIRVVDDGHGILPEDLDLAISSHATSKLTSADDLFQIATNGFRGEALASIAGVSKLTLQSRAVGQTDGAELKCDGGQRSPIKPWGGAVGTRLEVRHLFFNVPARKKFLKSVATELRTANETITRLALSHPNVGFALRHNQRTVIDIPPATTLEDRIELFFGGEVRKALLQVDSGAERTPRLTGMICNPNLDRGNSALQYLFVNGRWFRDRSLGHAFSDAYRGLVMSGRYPIGFLYLVVPPESVDVNVHPTKSEVRFRDQSAIYSLVRGAVKQRLLRDNYIPSVSIPQGVQETSPRVETTRVVTAAWEAPARDDSLPFKFPTPTQRTPSMMDSVVDTRVQMPVGSPPSPVTTKSIPVDAEDVNDEPQQTFDPAMIPTQTAFQLHDSYIVLESREGMVVIDQHALHERILFEQLRTRIRDHKLEIQRLLVPEPIELPPLQAAAVLEAKDELAQLGLEISDFGGNTIMLSSYPSLLGRKSPRDILMAVVDRLAMNDKAPAKEELLHLLLATMACKAAVKAGDPLSPDEIQSLLRLRDLAEDSHHCPHGRPTSLLFSRSELDRQFKRT